MTKYLGDLRGRKNMLFKRVFIYQNVELLLTETSEVNLTADRSKTLSFFFLLLLQLIYNVSSISVVQQSHQSHPVPHAIQ